MRDHRAEVQQRPWDWDLHDSPDVHPDVHPDLHPDPILPTSTPTPATTQPTPVRDVPRDVPRERSGSGIGTRWGNATAPSSVPPDPDTLSTEEIKRLANDFLKSQEKGE